jgi:hypothetical protein
MSSATPRFAAQHVEPAIGAHRRADNAPTLASVICPKCAAALAFAGVVLFASLAPKADEQRCAVCASPVRQDFDRDDSPHGRFLTDYVGRDGTIVLTTGGTPAFGRAMDVPRRAQWPVYQWWGSSTPLVLRASAVAATSS